MSKKKSVNQVSQNQDREKAKEKAKEIASKILNFRGAIRFKPDPLTVAYIQLLKDSKDTKDLKEKSVQPKWDLVGVVANESYTGCALIVIQNELIPGKNVFVKVGALAAMHAKIVWQKQLEENIYKIGLQYI